MRKFLIIFLVSTAAWGQATNPVHFGELAIGKGYDNTFTGDLLGLDIDENGKIWSNSGAVFEDDVSIDGDLTITGVFSGVIDGSGTSNKIAKWSDSDTLTDSSITDDGSTLTFTVPMADDIILYFGDDSDIGILYDETTDNRLEWTDGTNLLLALTDAGTTGDLLITGILTVSGNVDLTDDKYILYGADDDIQVGYDETTDNRLEFTDGTNLLLALTDAGTTGDVLITGILTTGSIALTDATGNILLAALEQDGASTDDMIMWDGANWAASTYTSLALDDDQPLIVGTGNDLHYEWSSANTRGEFSDGTNVYVWIAGAGAGDGDLGITDDLTVGDDTTLTDDVTIGGVTTFSPGSDDFELKSRAAGFLSFENQTSNVSLASEYFLADGDLGGVDSILTFFWSEGTYADQTNSSNMYFGYITSAPDRYIWSTNSTGTGSDLPIEISTKGNSPQLWFDTDGDLGVGTSSPGAELHVSNTATEVRLEATTADQDNTLSFYDDSALEFDIFHDTSVGMLAIRDLNGNIFVRYDLAEVVYNKDNLARNWRVKGDTDTGLLFVDGVNDRVGISTITPGAMLDVDGDTIIGGDDFDFTNVGTVTSTFTGDAWHIDLQDLAIGTETVEAGTELRVANYDNEQTTISIESDRDSNSNHGLIDFKARKGSNPTADTMIIGNIRFFGDEVGDDTWGAGAEIKVRAATTWSAGSRGAHIDFFVSDIGESGTTEALRLTETKDLVFMDAAAGIPYGSMYFHEASQTVDLVLNTYVKVTGWSSGLTNSVTIATSAFNVDYVGAYKIDWQIAGDTAGSNKIIEANIFINGVEQTDGSSERKFATGGDVGSFSGTAILDVTDISHDIDLRLKNTTDSTDLDIFDANFNVTMVGGT
jgi:hypothetical protein